MTDSVISSIKKLIDDAQTIVIIQPDNPDGDSLGSSLALEQILGDLNKEPIMVCGVDIPNYLHYLPGWDRVEQSLPAKYDLSIIVDTTSASLLESLTKHIGLSALASKPCLIIDHHSSESTISFATVTHCLPAAATAEVIYGVATELKWPINRDCAVGLTAAILADTMGLTADYTTANTVLTLAKLVEIGVSLSALENARRDFQRKSPELVHYKGSLLQRIEYTDDNKIATLTIPWEEIERYSPVYNPSILALDDMRLTTDTAIAIVFKRYPDGKVTGKIRANFGFPIARLLAEKFGGGGHDYAAGFKINDPAGFDKLKTSVIAAARELLTNNASL